MGPSEAKATSFWHAPPGQRFQHRYWRHRSSRHSRPMIVRLALLALGALVGVIGLLMLVLPGPGVLALAVSGALFASESLAIARLLDRLEYRIRSIWHRWTGRRG